MTFSLDELNDPGREYASKPAIILHKEFPNFIDNTAREQFFTCPTKWKYSTLHRIGPDPASVHLHAGGAYAAGLEVLRKTFYDENFSQEDALASGIEACIKYYGDFEVPVGSNKSCDRIVGALVSYVDEYPLATDIIKPYQYSTGKHAVEFTFAVPLPILHPVTKDPLIYSGRFDMLAVRDNVLFVEDDKTTSQLGSSWSHQWDLNSQFTGYVWAARYYDLEVAGAIVRGQSILKSGYGHAQVILYRPQWQLDRWFAQLCRDVERMVAAWRSGIYDYALGAACAAYSGCEFKKLCTSAQPEQWLPIHYRQKYWNPLAKDPEMAPPLEVSTI